MLNYTEINPPKKAFIFELDNVLYPEKDYLLQVYYLFANFLEYTETYPQAAELVVFFKKAYENAGPALIFEKAKEAFGIDEKYRENFLRLHLQAQLPLKLLLFKEALDLLQELVVDRKDVYIVTSGNPAQQMNKIRQIEWNGLEKYLRVYFADEVKPKPAPDVLTLITEEHGLKPEDCVILGVGTEDEAFARNAKIDFINVRNTLY